VADFSGERPIESRFKDASLADTRLRNVDLRNVVGRVIDQA
jgi:hypothetical protein